MQRRREVLTGIAGIATGAVGLTILPDKSKATTIDVQSIEVPNTTQEISSPVTGAQLAVSGEYSVNAEVVPDRVILRLEGKRATNQNYQQLTAEESGITPSKEFTEPFDFKSNLLDLQGVNAPLLTPAEVGHSKQIDIDVRLRLQVKRGGRILKEVSVEETTTLTVEKTLGEVTIGLEASGNMTVSD